MNLLHISAVLFGIGAIIGVTMATLHLRRDHVPLWPALLHAAAVLPAFVLLVLAIVFHGRRQTLGEVGKFQETPDILMGVSGLVFLLAAVGGLALFLQHAKRGRVMRPLIFIHGAAAVTGYILLLLSIFLA